MVKAVVTRHGYDTQPEVYSSAMSSRPGRTAVFCLFLLITGSVAALEFSDVYATLGADTEVSNTGLYIFPTLVIPSGGEFEGMGQAYTAVARDASFFDANPAGSATLQFTELTFAHNNWIADSTIEGVMYSRRLGDIGLDELGVAVGGKFLHVPFTEYDVLSRQVSGGRYSEGTIGVNASYNFDFGRSFEFPGLAVGATIKSAYRYVPPQIAPNQSAVGFAVDLGALTRFNFLKAYSSRTPNFGVGISLRNVGLPVQGEPLPSQFTAGIAYLPLSAITLATDIILPFSLAPGVPAPSLAGAAGMSVRIAPFFTAQAGMLLRWGGSRISMGANIDLTDISIDVNYNLDLATQFSTIDRFSVQARLNFGDEGRGALRDLVDSYYLDAWRASAAGDLEQAIELAERAISLNPEFTPAITLRDITLDTLQLQEDLRAIDVESLTDSIESNASGEP